MSSEETRRAIELERYFSVLPAFRGIYQDITYFYRNIVNDFVDNPYVSNVVTPLGIEEIKSFLKGNDLLGSPVENSDQRYWPGDKEEKS